MRVLNILFYQCFSQYFTTITSEREKQVPRWCFFYLLQIHRMKHSSNKKVLLRERKRHTARRVASARYDGGGGGTPSQVQRGYPVPGPGREVPHPRSREGTLSQLRGGTPSRPGWGEGVPPSIQTWDGVIPPWPDLGWGTPPPARPRMGYPHLPQDLGRVPPPPPGKCGLVSKHYLPSYYVRGR